VIDYNNARRKPETNVEDSLIGIN